MTNEERLYLLDRCIERYARAIIYFEQKKYRESWQELGKAQELKEVIEKFIDCQPTKYYKKYQQIVRFYQKTRNMFL